MSTKKVAIANALVTLATIANAKKYDCTADGLPELDIPGLEVVNVYAEERLDFKDWGFRPDSTTVPLDYKSIDFCSVTVTYTHPGQNDTINTAIWLPLDDKWNGKYLGMGGGGWAAGGIDSLASGVAQGYASANTDGGHSYIPDERFDFALNAESWGYLSKGNVHWVNLQNFASRSIEDLPKIAKQVIEGFYGEKPKYSYWTGCSTGGRQGLISAQRFPEDYNGILAVAPAINWVTFLVTELWPQIVMKKAKYWPEPAEFAALQQAAIDECDGLDGVKDGVISDAKSCQFDAKSAVGQEYDSNDEKRKISSKAAEVANAIWEGPMRDGERIWFGNSHEAQFGGQGPFEGLATTACDKNNKNCKGVNFPIADNWAKLFLAKDHEFDPSTMDEEDLWKALRKSRVEYKSVMDSAEPDLSAFKAAGGKLISWHGLADQLIPPGGMENYYTRVLAEDPKAADFYRYFEAPGVQHCAGGPGAFPEHALNSLVEWVEKGVAPDTLEANSPDHLPGPKKTRILCPYPQVAAYKGGNSNKAESFECADSIDEFSSKWGDKGAHDEL